MKIIRILAACLCLMLVLGSAMAEGEYSIYQKGDRNEEIAKFQQLLMDGGYLNDVADGIFGRKTERAVLDYQKANNLTQTGALDAMTQMALLGVEETVAEPAEEPAPEPAEEPAPVPAEEPVPESTEEPAPAEEPEVNAQEEPAAVAAPGGQLSFDGMTLITGEFGHHYLIEPKIIDDQGEPPVIYEATSSDTTFVYMTGVVTNTGAQKLASQSIEVSATVDGETYAGYTLFETDGGRNLKAYADLGAGESTNVYLLAEVPVSVESGDQSIDLTISLNGQSHTVTMAWLDSAS